jgi:hypothetical protein
MIWTTVVVKCYRNLQVLGQSGYHQLLGSFVPATQVIVQGNGSQQRVSLGLAPTALTYRFAWVSCFEKCTVK